MTKLAVYQRKTLSYKTPKRGFARRFSWLIPKEKPDEDLILEEIAKVMTQNPDLVIGPEYLFVNGNRPYDEVGKQTLVAKLLDMTRGKQTMLVPGTIIWTKGNLYTNSCPVIHNGTVVNEIVKKSLRAPDLIFCGGRVQGLDDEPVNDRFKFKSVEAYVESHLIEMNRVKYMIEICDDHAKTATQRVEMPHVADFQIVVSNEQYHHFKTARKGLFLKTGGLFIECNGNKPTLYIGQTGTKELGKVYSSNDSGMMLLNI